MEKSVFDISEFNIIQDDENYYVFRALNNGDHRDISEGITSDENGISRVRTDRERFEEEKGKAKYNAQSQISLEEVWDHIKIRYIKETNCISLSSNANVSIDYGQGYNEEYVMVRIPKQGADQVYSAGQYMLEEVSKKIDEALSNIPEDSKILELIRRIDAENSHKNIRDIVSDAYEGARSVDGKFSGKGNKIKSKTAIVQRFDRKQYFTDEQQLEYSKTIAKLTVLETHGILKSILPTKLDNSSLIATIGNAFSSGELVHYGDIDRTEMKEVPKEMMDILSLVQQLKEKNVNKDELVSLETRVIRLINDGYKFSKENGQLILGNGIDSISIKDIDIDSREAETEQTSELSIEDIYKLTKGRVSYEKAKIAIEFVTKTSQSRLKAVEYADIIRALTSENSQLAKVVEDECFAIDKDIISRENRRGLKIAESVNIGLSREQRRFVSNQEQLKLIAAVQELDPEQSRQIITSNGLTVEHHILDEILEKTDEISENQYFAEAIVDGIDFGKIYKTTTGEQRTITEEERNRLVSRLNNADCKKLYNAFVNAGVNSNDVPGYIINLLMDNGYKGHTLQELSRLDDLDTIIANNTKNLNCRIQALRLDKTLGIEDDSYIVPETSIRLRDYQQDTVQNIDRIHENKRVAGMILPTGAGKSFVAMTEMMKYKNSNIIFIAPQNTILSQFQNHILKNILHKKVITDEEIEELRKEGKEIPEDIVRSKDVKKVIEEAFPHLKMFCYATLNSTDEEWMKSQDVDLIVLDELHRAGAETWKPQIQKLLENNPNAKILGMTATPVRDVDHEDMARVLAEMSGDYTEEELIQKKYLASEMHVLDAMQDNIVVSPRIVTFDYTLGTSEEYQEVKRMLQEEKNPVKKEELSRIYKEMTAIIKSSEKQGMNGILAENIKKKNGRYIVFLPNNTTGKPAEEYIKAEIEKVKEYFKDVNPNIQAGYLLSDRENAKVENAAALEEFENSDSDELKLLFAVDMLNEGVHVDGIDGAVMLRPISENSKILYLQQIGRCIFSLDPNNPIADEDRPIIFDVYNNYLAQNMDREANKTNSTSDLQRLQTIVNWIERHNGYMPDINSENTKEARRAVTLKNIQKKYKKFIDRIENKNLSESEIYEIEQILELGKSIELWDLEIPERIIPPGERDIIRNDTFKVSGTQKEFVELFKKANTIKKDRKPSDGLRIKNTLLIMDVLTEYGLEISNKTISIDVTLGDVLAKLPADIREEILDEFDFDPEFKLGEEYNFAKKGFYNRKKIFTQYDIKDLRRYGIFEEFTKEYEKWGAVKVGEFCAVKDGFIVNGPKEFKNLSIMTGTLYDEEGYNYQGQDEQGFNKMTGTNKYGFYKTGIHSLTNEIYDNRGFKIDLTYRETGEKYDAFGFDIDRIHRETGEIVNKDGFNCYGEFLEKNSSGKGYYELGIFDYNGFDIRGINRYTGLNVNADGYDRDGFYYELQEDGTYKKTDVQIELGHHRIPQTDKYGFDNWGRYNHKKGLNSEYYSDYYDEKDFDVYGVHKDTKTRIDPNGKDRDGNYAMRLENGTYKIYEKAIRLGNGELAYFNSEGDCFEKQKDGTYKKTGRKTDSEGYNIHSLNQFNFDRKGFYWEKQEDGTYTKTLKTTDPEGYNRYGLNKFDFDREGNYWERQEDGTYINTHRDRDPEGYNCYGISEKDFDREGNYYEKQEDGTYKTLGKKRDADGYDKDDIDAQDFRIGETINIHGFDREGYYHEKQEDGTYKPTGLKYNPQGFRVDKRHIITKSAIDFRKFDIYGRCKVNKDSIYDKNGFKFDGTYMETGEKYHEGYNAYGVDEEGKDRAGKVAFEITFSREYINAVFTKGPVAGKEVIKKYAPKWKNETNEQYNRRIEAFSTEKLYLADQMYPKIRSDIALKVMQLRRLIKQREEKISQLDNKKASDKQIIEKLQKENDMLKQRINLINPMQEISK